MIILVETNIFSGDKMNPLLINNLSAQRDPDFTLTPQGRYASANPKLISAGHNGQTLDLDRPPNNGKVDFNDFEEVYRSRPAYDHFEKANYAAFADGQVQYYLDPSLSTPFIPEIFGYGVVYTSEPYVDPNGTVKPHFNLCLRNQGQLPLPGCGSEVRPANELTWITDTTAHRESIMASQQARRNQERYGLRI